MQDLLKDGQDSVEVGALPEHLPTPGAHVEQRHLGEQAGGHAVQLEGSAPGKAQGVGVQIREGGPLTLLGVPGEGGGLPRGGVLLLRSNGVLVLQEPWKPDRENEHEPQRKKKMVPAV